MRVWRISNYADLSGRGGLLAAGRWHHVETPIVYCADHPASAMLEMLVHIDFEDRPKTFQLIAIDVPNETDVTTAPIPANWREDIEATRAIGSSFIFDAKGAVLAVPSVIVPHGMNYLLAPSLLDAAGIRIASVESHSFDSRFLGTA